MFKRFLQEVNARAKAATRTQNTGKQLESTVADLLRREGFRDIQLNTIIRDVNGNRSEIDVIAKNRSFFKRFFSFSPVVPYGKGTLYVECKQYAVKNRIELDLVAKFKEVCSLNNISLNDALFVTTSSFVPRALTIGVRTVDGKQLQKWKRTCGRSNRWLAYFAVAFTLIAGMATHIRESRSQCIPHFRDFHSTSSCRSYEPPVTITEKTPEDVSSWIPFFAVQLQSPLPTEQRAREEALALIDKSIATGTGMAAWEWVHGMRQTLAHVTAAYDYIVICFPMGTTPALQTHSLCKDKYIVTNIDDCMCFKLEVPHVIGVPGYLSSYLQFRWETLKKTVGLS